MKAFCEKHDFSIEDSFWVGDNVGGIAFVGDFNFCVATIRTDIDEDAPEEELMKHYDYSLNATEFNLGIPNFHAWIHGYPRASKEWFLKMRKMREDFENAIKEERGKE